MTLLWIPFTLLAAFMQAWRNALQKQLRTHASTIGVTYARFIFALPLAGVYLWLVQHHVGSGQNQATIPTLTVTFAAFILLAALAQIAATALMVMLFKARNYAIGVGLAKSEAVIAAVLGALYFAAPLSRLAWLGVLVGGVAVWLMSLSAGTAKTSTASKAAHINAQIPKQPRISPKTLLLGLGSGLCFALATLYIREAALYLRANLEFGFLLSAAWVLFLVITTQTVLLTLWLLLREPQTFKALYTHKKLTLGVSLFSFVGSVGWFTAMSLQTVALVKTLGQIEVLFTLAISAWWFKERLQRSDYIGLVLIVVGAVLVMVA